MDISPVDENVTIGVQVDCSNCVGQPSAMSRNPPRLTGLIILIIESDLTTQDSLSGILEMAGADLQFEEQIQEALTVFRTFIPDCLLCNVTLTDGSGYILVEQLRQIEVKIGITPTPAIAIFDSDRIVNNQRALEAGFQSVVTKPWKSQDIINTIVRVVGRTQVGARYK